jgi:NADH dehydrogenase
LQLATKLGNKLGRRDVAGITLVERARTYLRKPLLHALAAGSMDPGIHDWIFSPTPTSTTFATGWGR